MSGWTAWRRVLPAVVGALLLVCASLVIVGVSIEHGSEAGSGTGLAVSSEHGQSHEGANEGAETAEPEHAGSGERIEAEGQASVLGVPIESPAALTGLAVVSVALAVLVWRRPTRLVVGGVVVFTVAAGVLDVAEIGRQFSGDRVDLAVLAMVIVLLRLTTLAGATVLWRVSRLPTSMG